MLCCIMVCVCNVSGCGSKQMNALVVRSLCNGTKYGTKMPEREQKLSKEARDWSLGKKCIISYMDRYEIPTKEWTGVLDQLMTT